MDRLKTLRSFSWSAVERQAEELFSSVRNAQSEGLTSFVYIGVIHAVNVEILKANGFTLAVNFNPPQGPRSVTISWSPFVDVRKSAELFSDDEEDDDNDEGWEEEGNTDSEDECCVSKRKCCPCQPSTTATNDKNNNNNTELDLNSLISSLIQSMGNNKKIN